MRYQEKMMACLELIVSTQESVSFLADQIAKETSDIDQLRLVLGDLTSAENGSPEIMAKVNAIQQKISEKERHRHFLQTIFEQRVAELRRCEDYYKQLADEYNSLRINVERTSAGLLPRGWTKTGQK